MVCVLLCDIDFVECVVSDFRVSNRVSIVYCDIDIGVVCDYCVRNICCGRYIYGNICVNVVCDEVVVDIVVCVIK